ncbi:MAG: hypothetical protein U0164_19840 [Gemmatimonadaceae bacterium]
MKAIPMKGRLKGKRITGYLWAGQGTSWTKKENYFQLEHDRLVTAILASPTGSFSMRCKGGTLDITMKNADGEVVGTALLALPRARKR